MKISLNILIDLLDFEMQIPKMDWLPAFRKLELLTPGSSACDSETLYVGLLSDALAYDRQGSQLVFLCLRDRMIDALETQDAMEGVLIVKKNMRLNELFNTVQRLFTRILQWQYALKDSTSNDCGIQDLLDLSETVIGNHIDVLDSTFKLHAYTKNIKIDDPVTNELLRLGYHPKNTLDRLQKNRRFEQYETHNDIIVSTDRLMSNYTTVKKVFHHNGTFSFIIVMVCNASGSDGILDLFRILADAIEHYAPKKSFRDSVSSFAEELLNGQFSSINEIKDRASSIGIPFRGEYNLFLLRFSDTDNCPFSHIASQLSQALCESSIFRFRNSILLLNRNVRYDNNRSNSEEKLSVIQATISGNSCTVGISNSFQALFELPLAYNQSVMAVYLGEYLPQRGKQYHLSNMTTYFFEDYSAYYECYASKQFVPDLTGNSMSMRVLTILREYEQRYHVRYLEVLHTYLQCECRASATAEKLNMHRNTVVYHIGRIEELLHISLSDPETRLKIMTGFMRTELEGFAMPADEFCPGNRT